MSLECSQNCVSKSDKKLLKKPEKEIPVNTPNGVALLPLYKVGVPINMLTHQVASYFFRPQDGSSYTNASENTIFISDILKDHTFKVVLVPLVKKNRRPTFSYTVTRLS
jgi:hypothetical protein